MRVLLGSNQNFLKGELKIEQDVSDGLGHSSKVMIDESENGMSLLSVHFLLMIKMKCD